MEQYLKKRSYFIEFLQRSCGDLKLRQALTAKNAENGLVINIRYHCGKKRLNFSKPNCQRNANMLTSRADFSRNVQLKARWRGVSASSIINEKHKIFEIQVDIVKRNQMQASLKGQNRQFILKNKQLERYCKYFSSG